MTVGKQLLRIYGRTLPQWSQPRIGWMTARAGDGLHPVVVAAIEPAKDRLDDCTSGWDGLDIFGVLQWSQPRIG